MINLKLVNSHKLVEAHKVLHGNRAKFLQIGKVITIRELATSDLPPGNFNWFTQFKLNRGLRPILTTR